MAERRLSSTDSWVRWVLIDCPDDWIPYVLRYFEPHQRRLEKLLQARHALGSELTLRLSGRGASHGWNLHAVLTLPTGMVVSEASDETLLGTLDRALDGLQANAKRHWRQTGGALLSQPAPSREFLQPRPRSGVALMASATA